MRHILFGGEGSFPYALLVKSSNLQKTPIEETYINPLKGFAEPKEFVAFSLKYNDNGKAPVTFIKEYLSKLLPALDSIGTELLITTDANYFKVLTNQKKAEASVGDYFNCVISGYAHMTVTYIPPHGMLFYKPEIKQVIDFGLSMLKSYLSGSYKAVGADVIKKAVYPSTTVEIIDFLDSLHQYPALTVDIETLSLNFWEAGIGTISFAWNKHEGGSFVVDLDNPLINITIKKELKKFFDTYQGTLIYHNGNFDIKVLVFELYMEKDFFNYQGMFEGIDKLTRNFEDTKLIAYLATNSTSGNNLSLKYLAQQYLGNYAQEDINDITKIPLPQLLEYNLLDGLGTWYVYDTYYPIMVADQQLEIYEKIFKPSVAVILNMELVGLPLNINRVYEVEAILLDIQKSANDVIHSSKFMPDALKILRQRESDACHAKWKKKTEPISYFDYVGFNTNSPKDVTTLLFEVMGFEPLDYTPTGQPSTSKDDLKPLLYHTTDSDKLEVIRAFLDLAEVNILLNNFIKAFKNKSIKKSDGWYYLHGNFNLGGTVSGRLSSSNPNLQNIPSSGNKYAKLVKSCVQAPPGKLQTGADFASLEDRISALTTKDPNKLRVYTDGYDGHCLRAFYYFRDQMPDIQETVESINSIETKYKDLRQESKNPTFALTYQGTWHTLVKNLGWSEEKAKDVERAYHEMYKVSDDWVQGQIKQAHIDGYITGAFGLRVRTPLLKQTLYNAPKLPYEAAAEQRTAGNALGQSWGLLNNRAAIELFERLKQRPDLRLKILPIAHVHDAQYFIVDDDIEAIHWLNINLVECMEWQDHPAIYHPEVKLGGQLSIFYPDWSVELPLPERASQSEIIQLAKEFKNGLNKS